MQVQLNIDIPQEVLQRMIVSLKATHPELTDGLQPSAAIKAVIMFWLRTNLITFESDLARNVAETAVDKAIANRDNAVHQIGERAKADTEFLLDPSKTTMIIVESENVLQYEDGGELNGSTTV